MRAVGASGNLRYSLVLTKYCENKGIKRNYVQPYQHHENVPIEGINVYSFALKPEEHQPSGTCNFSRIDNATLQIDSASAGVAKIFAVNYNVLRKNILRTKIIIKIIISILSMYTKLTCSSATLSNCGKFLKALITTL